MSSSANLLPTLDFPAPKHGGNTHVDPENWGMTMQQFNDFIEAMKNSEQWERVKNTLGPYKQKRMVTGYDVNVHWVKQWTAGTGSSVALRMNPTKPLRAQIMISHPWGEDILETQEALNKKITDKSTVIWFCIFANYQSEDGAGPSVDDQVKMEPFKKVITMPCEKMLVVHTSTADLYERLWCVHELDEALSHSVKVAGAFSGAYSLDDVIDRNSGKIKKIDTANAECGNQRDKDYIRNLILAKDGGFDGLDSRIEELRLDLDKDDMAVSGAFSNIDSLLSNFGEDKEIELSNDDPHLVKLLDFARSFAPSIPKDGIEYIREKFNNYDGEVDKGSLKKALILVEWRLEKIPETLEKMAQGIMNVRAANALTKGVEDLMGAFTNSLSNNEARRLHAFGGTEYVKDGQKIAAEPKLFEKGLD